MTELTFLVELLLNHKLQKATKDAVAARLKEVEASMAQRSQIFSGAMPPPGKPVSSRDVAVRHPDLVAAPPPEPEPVVNIAQTPAASAAMASRQQAINESLAGKIDKTTGRPKKW